MLRSFERLKPRDIYLDRLNGMGFNIESNVKCGLGPKYRLDECDQKEHIDQKDPGGRCDCANASRVFCRLRYHGKLKKQIKKCTFAGQAFFPLRKRLLNVRSMSHPATHCRPRPYYRNFRLMVYI